MGYANQLQAIAVFGAIVGLLLIGFLISLASGAGIGAGRHRFWLYLGNLYGVLIRILAYLVGLLALQQVVGFPLDVLW
jgi:hypothetical protein